MHTYLCQAWLLLCLQEQDGTELAAVAAAWGGLVCNLFEALSWALCSCESSVCRIQMYNACRARPPLFTMCW